jgi:periplasmic divalent cation tolerance protein
VTHGSAAFGPLNLIERETSFFPASTLPLFGSLALPKFCGYLSFMRMYYITLNTDDEARRISKALLEQQLAVCTNWFPIACAYRWEGKIVEEPETVLLVKTQPGYRQAIEQVVRQHISYTNLMAEIAPESVNESFVNWLNAEVPLAAGGGREKE